MAAAADPALQADRGRAPTAGMDPQRFVPGGATTGTRRAGLGGRRPVPRAGSSTRRGSNCLPAPAQSGRPPGWSAVGVRVRRRRTTPNTEPPTKPGAPVNNLISYADDEHGHSPRISPTSGKPGLGGVFKNADTRRIIRRGIPYGQPFDPSAGAGHGPDADFAETGAGNDPVIGKDTDVTLKLDTKSAGTKLHFAQFVRTEGTVYAFAPSLSTLRDLAGR